MVEPGKMNFDKYLLLLFPLLLKFGSIFSQLDHAAPRISINLNKGWQFTKGAYEALSWQSVDLPHTWNAKDVMDDTAGYFRGACWYKKTISLPDSLQSKELFLYFKGANQETEVYINGIKAGSHRGGYTAFSVPIGTLLHFGRAHRNEIAVRVDNSPDPNIPPLSADFTFYGGLYRDVFLVAVNKAHFSCTDHASNGIYITTPRVSAESATLHTEGTIRNSSSSARLFTLSTVVRDAKGRKVLGTRETISLEPLSSKTFTGTFKAISHPHLWSPEDPYLYSVDLSILDAASGKLLDRVRSPLGFRWVHFDADKGFFLNGKPYRLAGISRHQDHQGMGNALPASLATRDMEWVKRMGANFLRIAHYPQDPAVLEACDRLGLLCSVEIPVVNEITESDSFYRNCMDMQVEMIRQNFNHPSVIIWGTMNEVLLKSHFTNDKPRQKEYYSHIATLASSLDSLTRKEDPYRITMMANHGDINRYREAGLTGIPMLVGWNLYSGWYGGKMEDFPSSLDRIHKEFPNTPFMVTEYGADADPRIRSSHPVRFDKSVEFVTQFHAYYWKEILKRPFVAGSVIWNLADFNSETRNETMPHINNKGLLSWDRIPKDPYYFYEATWSRKPFVKIASSYWKTRAGVADSTGRQSFQPLQVASNLDSIELFVNGKSHGFRKVVDGLCEWTLPFSEGVHLVRASGRQHGKVYSDQLRIDFKLQPYLLTSARNPFREINILLGTGRTFMGEEGRRPWLPDQPYHTGAWGSVGGRPFKIDNGKLPYGTDKLILGTDDDPIYQTQQVGISRYQLDVPPGSYELTLHFAEIEGGVVKVPPYDLSDSSRQEKQAERVFNVYVNDSLFLSHFNIAAQFGTACAVIKKLRLVVSDGRGVRVRFEAVTGEPVLNALQLRRL